MRFWHGIGFTDHRLPEAPWTDGLRATRLPLAAKLEEMERFAKTHDVGQSD